jgi:beta-glucanase (GH16 family)
MMQLPKDAPHRSRWAARLAALFVGALAVEASTPACAQYALVWHDEFDGASLDPTKWEAQVGNGCPSLCGWGNNELQHYRAENAVVANGVLSLVARREAFGGAQYTSARLRTKLRGDWRYGRFEVRAKVPTGRGFWPAFWLLPTDDVYGTWAASGEIDVLEVVGHEPQRVHGTLHYGGTWPANNSSSASFVLPGGSTFADDFHVFAAEWEPGQVRWYVDGVQYAARSAWWSAGGPYPAPFDQRFHVLLNLAVGGDWPGAPTAATVFPQAFEVDYVRVYQDLGNGGACRFSFDDMEHGAPLTNGYFTFDGPGAGGGIAATYASVPPAQGGFAALSAAWGNGGVPGYLGGFGRRFPLDLRSATHFELWIDPPAGVDATIEVNVHEDDDGDDTIPGVPDGADDEFQYTLRVAPSGGEVQSGGGWQRVVVPLASFVDDNSYHFGGNGLFDPSPVGAGGNGRLVNVVLALVSHNGAPVAFTTDAWQFTRRASSLAGRVWEDTNGDGSISFGEGGLAGVTVELVDLDQGALAATRATGGDGSYEFEVLVEGPYDVRVVPGTLPPTATPTADPDGVGTPHVYRVTLGCDDTRVERDLGYRTSVVGTRYCSPAASNSTGAPARLFATGSLFVLDDDLTLWAQRVPNGSFGYFLTSRGQVFVPGAGGSQGAVCVGPSVGRVVGGVIFQAGVSGTVSVTADLGALPTPTGAVAVQPGDSWYFQAWFRDANPGLTSNLTDAVCVTYL